MIMPLAAGLVEQLLKIDIRWLYIPVGIVALLLVIEIVHVIVRHNKNKGITNPLDAIDEALELEGHSLDELTQADEYIFEIENGKLISSYSASAPKTFEENNADNAVEVDSADNAAEVDGTDKTIADNNAINTKDAESIEASSHG